MENWKRELFDTLLLVGAFIGLSIGMGVLMWYSHPLS